MYSDESEAESASDTEECYDEVPTRVVTTVPAKEPRLDQKPVKSALKKARAKNGKHSYIYHFDDRDCTTPSPGAGTPPTQNGRRHGSSPAQDKHQGSRSHSSLIPLIWLSV